jgi:hypothetical protein
MQCSGWVLPLKRLADFSLIPLLPITYGVTCHSGPSGPFFTLKRRFYGLDAGIDASELPYIPPAFTAGAGAGILKEPWKGMFWPLFTKKRVEY